MAKIALISYIGVAVLTLVACRRPLTLNGLPAAVVLAVEDAKNTGRRSATVSTTVDTFQSTSLDEELRESSVFVAVATRLDATMTIDEAFVTWSVFNVERELTTSRVPTTCLQPTPSVLSLSKSELAVGRLGGTKDIRGVRVEWESQDTLLPLRRGGRYLLIGDVCAGRQLKPAAPGFWVVALESDGRLLPLEGQSIDVAPAFFRELMNLATLDAVERRLR